MTTPATVSPAGQPAPRRRFRASDVADHLDMLVIGQVCLGVSLAGYSKLLDAVFSRQSGTLDRLLLALDAAQTDVIAEQAHAFKGETSVLGLKALAQQRQVQRCMDQQGRISCVHQVVPHPCFCFGC